MNIDIENKSLKELLKLKKQLEKELIKVDNKIHDLGYSFNKSTFLEKFKQFVDTKDELCLICPIDYNKIYVMADVKKYLKENFSQPVKLTSNEYGDFKLCVYCSNATCSDADNTVTDITYDTDPIYSDLDKNLIEKYNVSDFSRLFNEDDCRCYYLPFEPFDSELGVDDYDAPESPWQDQTGRGIGKPILYKMIKKKMLCLT